MTVRAKFFGIRGIAGRWFKLHLHYKAECRTEVARFWL